MSTKTMQHELGEYAVRAGPGLTASGLTLFGVAIGDVVQVLVAIYTILQIGWFLWARLKRKDNGG